MSLEFLIKNSFPKGLTYNEAAQLCIRLFCSVEGLPENIHAECTKENLSKVFSELVQTKFVSNNAIEAPLYGANFHKINSVGHWVEIIASVFKNKKEIDASIGRKLVSKMVSYET